MKPSIYQGALISLIAAVSSPPAFANPNLLREKLHQPVQFNDPTNLIDLNSDVPSEDDDKCPDVFVAGISYIEGDLVEKNGVVYQCRSYPNAQWCSTSGYEPGSMNSYKAWDIVGRCEGTFDHVPSTSLEERMLQLAGCPALYSGPPPTSYTTGDQVSVTSGASSLIYECASTACNSNTPESETGWTLIGYCEGTITPSISPTKGATTTTTTTATATNPPTSNSPTSTSPTSTSPTKAATTTTTTTAAATNPPTPTTSRPTNVGETNPPTTTPSASPSAAPSASPVIPPTTPEVDSTLTWDVDCTALNSTTIVDVAKIVEESVYLTTDPNLPSHYTLQIVYVYELCNQTVPAHTGFPPVVRRLQSSLSEMQMYQVASAATGFSESRLQSSINEVKLYQLVSTACSGGCEEEIFSATITTLVATIEDGSLTSMIQNKSENVINVAISPNVTSNYTVTTSRPTSAPTKVTPYPSKSPTRAPFKAPVTPSPSAAPIKGTITTTPTGAPITPSPVTCGVVNGTQCTVQLDCDCAGLTCLSAGYCGDPDDVTLPSASPSRRPTPKPTKRPRPSKSSKNNKTPKPVTPKPTPAPVTPRPSKASKSSKRSL